MMFAASIATAHAQDAVLEPLEVSAPAGRIPSRLYLPPGPGPHPAVIMLPDQHGPDMREVFYAERLVDDGIAVLILHVWSPRGIVPEERPAEETDPAALLPDLRAAAVTLRTDPRIAGDRIGVWGFGLGGGTAMLARALADPSLGPAVAFYPPCGDLQAMLRRVAVGVRLPPLLVVAAEEDETGEPSACAGLLRDMNEDGGVARVVTVEGATYAFDTMPPLAPAVEQFWPRPGGGSLHVRSDILAAEEARARACWFLAMALGAPSARR